MTDSVLGNRDKQCQEKPFPLALQEGGGLPSDGGVRQEIFDKEPVQDALQDSHSPCSFVSSDRQEYREDEMIVDSDKLEDDGAQQYMEDEMTVEDHGVQPVDKDNRSILLFTRSSYEKLDQEEPPPLTHIIVMLVPSVGPEPFFVRDVTLYV